jgi:hypothetical protein
MPRWQVETMSENAPEVTAPERIRVAPLWPEGASWADAKTFVGEPGPANEGTVEYVLASKADAQAEELKTEVERLKAENARFLIAIETANYGIEEMVLGGDAETPAPLIADDVWAVASSLRAALKATDAEQEGDDA